jgi:U3 small nucleolar RNA-associated protein 5
MASPPPCVAVALSTYPLTHIPQTDTTKRYTEPSSLAVRSGELELGLDASADDLPTRALDGALDADLAELSLGQRLTAIHGFNDPISFDSSSSDEEDEEDAGTAPRQKSRSKRTNGIRGDAGPSIPPTSLTRTLIQALHSSDVRLLETCLAHSDHALITATVRRLPPQLAVPLLDACVERLGRGARAANVKGGGGGASAQRGIGLVKWVKVVLAVHSAHLMTVGAFFFN